MGEAHHVGIGVYREGVLRVPASPRRDTSIAGVAVGLTLAVASSVGIARTGDVLALRAAAARPADPLVTVLTNATSLRGGDRLCALTQRGSQHAVTCLADEAYPRAGAWPSPPVAAGSFAGRMALTTDGRGVVFRTAAERAEPFALPPTGAHGRALEARRVAWYSNEIPDGRAPFSATLIARTEDGALLMESSRHDWITLLDAAHDVRGFAVYGQTYYAITASGATLAGDPRGRYFAPDLPPPEPVTYGLPIVRDPREIAVRGAFLCVRSRAGAVTCVDRLRSITYDLVGLSGGADAMALGDRDLCVRSLAGAWWCARGPSNAERSDELDIRAFRRAPSLDRADEVAFAPGLGCARWPSGVVRCWGPAAPSAHAR